MKLKKVNPTEKVKVQNLPKVKRQKQAKEQPVMITTEAPLIGVISPMPKEDNHGFYDKDESTADVTLEVIQSFAEGFEVENTDQAYDMALTHKSPIIFNDFNNKMQPYPSPYISSFESIYQNARVVTDHNTAIMQAAFGAPKRYEEDIIRSAYNSAHDVTLESAFSNLTVSITSYLMNKLQTSLSLYAPIGENIERIIGIIANNTSQNFEARRLLDDIVSLRLDNLKGKISSEQLNVIIGFRITQARDAIMVYMSSGLCELGRALAFGSDFNCSGGCYRSSNDTLRGYNSSQRNQVMNQLTKEFKEVDPDVTPVTSDSEMYYLNMADAMLCMACIPPIIEVSLYQMLGTFMNLCPDQLLLAFHSNSRRRAYDPYDEEDF